MSTHVKPRWHYVPWSHSELSCFLILSFLYWTKSQQSPFVSSARDQRWTLPVVRYTGQQVLLNVMLSYLGALSCRTSLENWATMNFVKPIIVCLDCWSLQFVWGGVYSRSVFYWESHPWLVSKKQSTHSVECRVERGKAMTENDGRGPLVEYLRFVCRRQRRNPCGLEWMHQQRVHVIESDAYESSGPNL
jgi:hypothetical protein